MKENQALNSRETETNSEFPSEISEFLGMGLQEVAPSAQIKKDLLVKIVDLPQEPKIAPHASNSAHNSLQVMPDTAAHINELHLLQDLQKEGKTGFVFSHGKKIMRFSIQIAAAFALLVVGAGIGLWSAMDSLAATRDYAALNQAQDVTRVNDTMPDGHIVTLTWSNNMEMAAVTMPAELSAPQGHKLQVWLRHENQIKSVGFYQPGKKSSFSFIDAMPTAGDEFFVTIEPANGVTQPTGKPIITWKITAENNVDNAAVHGDNAAVHGHDQQRHTDATT